MVELILRGKGSVACEHPVWRRDPYALPAACPQDIEKAKTLFDEVGYNDGLEVELFAAEVSPYFMPMAVAYKKMAAQADITVKLTLVPYETYYVQTHLKSGNSQYYLRPEGQLQYFSCQDI